MDTESKNNIPPTLKKYLLKLAQDKDPSIRETARKFLRAKWENNDR